jgi:hypothetical protein
MPKCRDAESAEQLPENRQGSRGRRETHSEIDEEAGNREEQLAEIDASYRPAWLLDERRKYSLC